jgi:hypothetical protein
MPDRPYSQVSNGGDLWNRNPFPEGTPAHHWWKDRMLWLKEHLVLLDSKMLASMPAEEASSREFLDHHMEILGGMFDTFATAFFEDWVRTDEGAQVFEDTLRLLETEIIARAGKHSYSFTSPRVLSSETKLRLKQRRQYWSARMLRAVRERKEADRANAILKGGGVRSSVVQRSPPIQDLSLTDEREPQNMDNLSELPEEFQNAFEVVKAKAEFEYATRAKRFPHHPEFAASSFHLPVLIHSVFFGYCEQARNACAKAFWSLKQARYATDAAWQPICDFYFVREGATDENQKVRYRAALWQTAVNDSRWEQHLSELATLGKATFTAPADTTCETVPGKNLPDRNDHPVPTPTGGQGSQPDKCAELESRPARAIRPYSRTSLL